MSHIGSPLGYQIQNDLPGLHIGGQLFPHPPELHTLTHISCFYFKGQEASSQILVTFAWDAAKPFALSSYQSSAQLAAIAFTDPTII